MHSSDKDVMLAACYPFSIIQIAILFGTEVHFEVPVVPVGIDIYETYHPSAVVRILACSANPSMKRHPGEVE